MQNDRTLTPEQSEQRWPGKTRYQQGGVGGWNEIEDEEGLWKPVFDGYFRFQGYRLEKARAE